MKNKKPLKGQIAKRYKKRSGSLGQDLKKRIDIIYILSYYVNCIVCVFYAAMQQNSLFIKSLSI